MKNGGLLETDLVYRFNTNNYYKNYTEVEGVKVNILSTFDTLCDTKSEAEEKFKLYTDPTSMTYDKDLADVLEGYSIVGLDTAYQLSGVMHKRIGWHVEFALKDGAPALTADALALFESLNE